MIYTVTFNPAIDYVIHLSSPLQAGIINRTTAEDFQFGGKGINVSGVLKNLGIDSTALGFVAGFTGKALEQGLQLQGLQTELISVEQGMTRINVKVKGQEETEINGMGPTITSADMKTLYEKLDRLQSGDILVLSGSIPGCLPQDTYEQILAHIQQKALQTVVDATGALLVNVLKYRPFLIKPNNHELGDIFGVTPVTDEDILNCCHKLQAMGGRNILVSLAGDGALLLDEQGQSHRIGCPKGTVVNSVGAGDSMVAGFLAGWLQTGDYDYALKLGTAAGSATAFSLGLADGEYIQNLLQTL